MKTKILALTLIMLSIVSSAHADNSSTPLSNINNLLDLNCKYKLSFTNTDNESGASFKTTLPLSSYQSSDTSQNLYFLIDWEAAQEWFLKLPVFDQTDTYLADLIKNNPSSNYSIHIETNSNGAFIGLNIAPGEDISLLQEGLKDLIYLEADCGENLASTINNLKISDKNLEKRIKKIEKLLRIRR